jgi:hypothetical protein
MTIGLKHLSLSLMMCLEYYPQMPLIAATDFSGRQFFPFAAYRKLLSDFPD